MKERPIDEGSAGLSNRFLADRQGELLVELFQILPFLFVSF